MFFTVECGGDIAIAEASGVGYKLKQEADIKRA
jgi:hypothetical protein